MSALSDQTAAAAIVRELARATWAKAARDGEPWAEGEPRIPDPAALPVAAVQEAVACAGAVVDIEPPGTLMVAPSGPPPPMPGGLALYWVWLPVRTARPDLASSPDPETAIGAAIEAVHAAWSAPPDGERGRHPLAPWSMRGKSTPRFWRRR